MAWLKGLLSTQEYILRLSLVQRGINFPQLSEYRWAWSPGLGTGWRLIAWRLSPSVKTQRRPSHTSASAWWDLLSPLYSFTASFRRKTSIPLGSQWNNSGDSGADRATRACPCPPFLGQGAGVSHLDSHSPSMTLAPLVVLQHLFIDRWYPQGGRWWKYPGAAKSGSNQGKDRRRKSWQRELSGKKHTTIFEVYFIKCEPPGCITIP